MTEKYQHVRATHDTESATRVGTQVSAPEIVPELASELDLRAWSNLSGMLCERQALSLQQTVGNQAVQRAIVQAKTEAQPDADLARRIRSASTGGLALDSATRDRLQKSLDADVSNVRVHVDDEAARLSESVKAVAFTTGSHIFFRHGMYQPDTAAGLRLLAHEVAHTLQQSNGPVEGVPASADVSISDPSDRFEQAADRAADQVMSSLPDAGYNTPIASSPISAGQQIAVQRMGWDDLLTTGMGMISPLASTLAPAVGLGGAATLPITAASAVEAGALPGTAAYDAIATAIDAGAASDFVAAWGGPEALMAAAGQGLGSAEAAVAGGTEAALATAATLPADAAAALGSAATVPELGALATLPEAAMTGLATGALPGTAEYASLAGAIDTSAAADFVAAWGGPEALMAAAGGSGEAAALGGTEALALGGAEAAGAAGAGAAGGGLAAAALPVAAVVGAGAAGVAAGYGLDQLSNYVGQKITGNEQGDYSISAGIASLMTSADQGLTSLWADPSKPAYTQTLGWQLANWLD